MLGEPVLFSPCSVSGPTSADKKVLGPGKDPGLTETEGKFFIP